MDPLLQRIPLISFVNLTEYVEEHYILLIYPLKYMYHVFLLLFLDTLPQVHHDLLDKSLSGGLLDSHAAFIHSLPFLVNNSKTF